MITGVGVGDGLEDGDGLDEAEGDGLGDGDGLDEAEGDGLGDGVEVEGIEAGRGVAARAQSNRPTC
jgi:hypothetical protein